MENLGIDAKLLVAQIVNFVLFFIIIKKYVVKPFLVFLENEQEKDAEKTRTLDKLKLSEERLVEEESKMKTKMKKEMEEMLAQTKKEAQLLKADLVKQAESDAEEIRKKAKKQMEEEKENLYREIKDKIAKTSMFLVETALKESLDDVTKKRITNYILKKFEGKVNLYEN